MKNNIKTILTIYLSLTTVSSCGSYNAIDHITGKVSSDVKDRENKEKENAQAKVVADKAAKEKADAQAEADRIAKEKAATQAEADRIAKEKADAQTEADRIAKEKAATQAEADRIAKEKAATQAEADRIAKEKADAQAEADRIAKEKAATQAEADRIAKEKESIVSGLVNNMVLVSSGTFSMGTNDAADRKPIHSVTLSSFYIGKYEVTQKEYKALMGISPSKYVGENLPVEQVNFNDAVEFCNKLNQLKGLPNAYDSSGKIINFKSYRLPTEAEWEFASKGGNKSQGYKYSGSDSAIEVAWLDSNSANKTHDVGTKKPNELGIYDMSGNVNEWCSDWYDSSYYSISPESDPYNSNSSTNIIVSRGGSFNYPGSFLAHGVRYDPPLTYRGGDQGFRIVKRN